MLVIFILDTSASMAARSGVGLSLLDQAKAIVEHYVKVRRGEVTGMEVPPPPPLTPILNLAPLPFHFFPGPLPRPGLLV